MFKVSNKDFRTTYEVVLVSLLITLNTFHFFLGVSIVDFEQTIVFWD